MIELMSNQTWIYDWTFPLLLDFAKIEEKMHAFVLKLLLAEEI